jgi:putative flippase GtrA
MNKSNNITIQFIKYFFASALALITDFALLYILTEFLSFYYLASASLSFTAGLLVTYILSKKYIFTESTISNTKYEFVIFKAIGIAGLGINSLSLKFLTEKLGLYYMYSKFITAFITYLWNFFCRKYILFNRRNS